MPIDRILLDVLVCPVSKQPIFPVEQRMLDMLNHLIEQGKIHSANGEVVDRPFSDALVTRNHSMIYRVENGIPIMLEDQGVPAHQLDIP